ncbi:MULTISPECIES: GIN domain-containing protein [unclassified Oceanispirochaeta]|uniref:GIN domain-containing protein n=1 Tax=unclassified Oceanispirochaeta TaxID=2635722 RepID=UPI000E094AB1|nr:MULTISPECIES: DUF2807 domain-containing protein [unclassified Oceanispirochaeta]MBF9016352.1 DUF2807 domain-containing protein [Oceanispirochaeta sp. M2]NPD72814.1 hypothetical protein [Oceanispirochaeta sp. M1]RDG31658.1 hypothetical protein DV872_11950 [Oceanispirochaeta sp. M1]
MKKINRLLIIAITVSTLAGCSMFNLITGSGDAVDTNYDFNSFTAVSINETCDLTVVQGDTFSVIITTDDNIADYLEVTESAGTVSIALKSGNSYNNIIFEAYITMPVLNGLSANGASEADASGFSSTETITVSVNGASEVDMAYTSTAAISASVDGASDLIFSTQTITGGVNLDCNGASNLEFSAANGSSNADVNCDGASEIDMRDFTANNVVVEIDGASDAWVNLTGTLSGSVHGASELRYRGTFTMGNLDVEFASSAGSF